MVFQCVLIRFWSIHCLMGFSLNIIIFFVHTKNIIVNFRIDIYHTACHMNFNTMYVDPNLLFNTCKSIFIQIFYFPSTQYIIFLRLLWRVKPSSSVFHELYCFFSIGWCSFSFEAYVSVGFLHLMHFWVVHWMLLLLTSCCNVIVINDIWCTRNY